MSIDSGNRDPKDGALNSSRSASGEALVGISQYTKLLCLPVSALVASAEEYPEVAHVAVLGYN
jgi:hypothetical protein